MAVKRTKVPSQFGKGAAYFDTHMNPIMRELKPDNCILQGGLVKQQSTANMTTIYPDMVVAIGTTVVQVLTGNSGTLTAAAATKKKMAILEVGSDGTVDIKYGAEVDAAQTPVVPATSLNHAKICAIGPILSSTTTITNAIIDNTERDMIR